MNLLTSLRYLVALSEHRHFVRAAESCHITQPALSNALRALEKEFGTPIVKRTRSYVGLTPEGERVLATAPRMLHEHALLQQELASRAGQPRGRLQFGRGADGGAGGRAFCGDAAGLVSGHCAGGARHEFAGD